MNVKQRLGLMTGMALVALAPAASAQDDSLTYYCAAQVEWCEAMAAAFTAETGIPVNMTRRSSGETYAQLLAERDNPRGDVWWGGTGDPHLQAAEEGLTAEYESPMLGELQDWAVRQGETSGNKTVGIYAGGLGFGYNTELLEGDAPACWEDLLDPRFEGEIQVANPNSSGTAYTLLATLVQLLGEDEAFEFLAAMHPNVSEYTQSGSAPIRAAARGEATIGIVFMHDAVAQAVEGFPIAVVAPCEGTGYEVGSMSIVADGPNPDAARAFYDWALSSDAQSIAATVNAFQVPSNVNAPTPPEAPNLDEIRLIDYDFATYGSSDTRSRLLQRWDEEIGSLP